MSLNIMSLVSYNDSKFHFQKNFTCRHILLNVLERQVDGYTCITKVNEKLIYSNTQRGEKKRPWTDFRWQEMMNTF